jgi:polysaccharide export outer membrane protein
MHNRLLRTTPTRHRHLACTLTSILAVGGLFCALQGSAQVAPSNAPRTFQLNPLPTTSTILPIGPGDLLDVEVFNTPELSGKHQVSPTGKIDIPGAGDIVVDGLSPLLAGAEIASQLKSSQVMLDPQVTVLVEDHASREVSVLGQVNRPGSYPLQGWPSLASALAAAGGVTDKAGSTITITHQSEPTKPLHLRMDSNGPDGDEAGIVLQNSDVVFVSEAGRVYVVGDVQRPGEFYISNGRPLNALEAIALAEGMKENARPESAAIIRATRDGAETIPINLKRIAKNLDHDPRLEPSDILVVPHSGFKEFELSVLPSLTGAAANAVALALVTR